MYTRTDSAGRVYQFTPDTHDLAPFSETTDTTVHDTGYRTVAIWDLDEGEGVAFGEGNSKNPDKAEAYIYLDAKDNSSTPVAITGQVRLQVLNAADEPVATIYQNKLGRLRNGDPDTDARGDWGVPFPYQAIRDGKGEVLGKGGYKIGIAIKTKSGSITFSKANSRMEAEGFSGSVQN